MKSLQNCSNFPQASENNTWCIQNPTITIKEGESGWAEAYLNWLNGKPPTDNPEWKKGCFLIFDEN
jgi:hypothetical protein